MIRACIFILFPVLLKVTQRVPPTCIISALCLCQALCTGTHPATHTPHQGKQKQPFDFRFHVRGGKRQRHPIEQGVHQLTHAIDHPHSRNRHFLLAAGPDKSKRVLVAFPSPSSFSAAAHQGEKKLFQKHVFRVRPGT